MELYGSLVANEGSGGGGGGTTDVPIKSISVNGQGVAPVNKNVNIDVPTKTSELTNDSNFASTDDIPTKVSELENDSNFASTSDIPTKVSELTNDSKFVTETDLTDKDYADKTYVGEQIAQSEHLKREIVTVLPEQSEADDHTIYMLKDDSIQGNDKYKEYMLINGVVQCVGDTSVDLTDYAKKTDIPTELPANGGNADTVNNHTVESNVPVDAKFTDTVYDDEEVKKRISDNGYGEVAGGKNLLNHNIIDSEIRNCSVLFKNDTFYVTNKGNYSYFVLSAPTIVGKSYTVTIKDWSDYSYRCIASVSDLSDNTLASMIINDATLSMTFIAVGTESIIRINPNNTQNEMSNTITFKCMLEEGSVATEYEPYFQSNKMLAEEVSVQNESLSVIGKCKNLFNPTLQTNTQSGVTCTNNGDGTYILNGTSTRDRWISFGAITLNPGKYKFIATKNNVEVDNLCVSLNRVAIAKSGEIFTIQSKSVCDIGLSTYNKTFDNVIIKPMITTNLNAAYDDFVPYTGDGETLASDVAEIKKDLGDLTFSASETTLTITDGTHTWTLEANN